MRLHSLIVAALLSAGVTATGTAATRPVSRPDAAPPGIRLWTSHGETYRRGERVQVFFRTEQDAYVTILRVDSDGRVRVLFPREPWEDNGVRGGYTYDVPNYGRHDAFVVDDDPGVGYVFGVASADRFTYDPFTRSNHWDLALVSDDGRIHGDPYQSLEELIQLIVPPGYADYDTHLLPYYVEQHYDYPRFLCYDCHTYVAYSAWNPYTYGCPRFTLFVYRDPYYFYPSYWYPTRYYGGTRVVYSSPREHGSQYIFKSREDQSAPAIAYRDRSRETPNDRRPADRGVRGADIGAVGTVPVPGGRRMVGDQGGTPVRVVTPDVTRPSPNLDAGGRRTAPPEASGAEPRRSQPRGVYIDPYAQPKPGASDEGDRRRIDPVYLGRPQPVDGPKPDARPTESRPEPRATPQPERRTEPRPSEPRATPPPRSVEPRSAPAPRSAEPRSVPAPRSPAPPPSRAPSSEGRRRP
jgi:hypothetical protein